MTPEAGPAVVPSFDVVVPTSGRPSLGRLLAALDSSSGPRPRAVHVVDGRHRGPAAARNEGWRRSSSEWIVFLDDDVVPARDWLERLADDLGCALESVAGVQGRVRVPRPRGRRATDWERHVGGLETARWVTADMAYRRSVLGELGGFDERFPRAYREDADLALRVRRAGHELRVGTRTVVHPVGPAGFWTSVVRQAGNADDALMRALHGRAWRAAAGAPPGRLRRHVVTTAAGVAGLVAALAARRGTASLCAVAWLTGTLELAWGRIEPGPRTPREVACVLATSPLLPPAATAFRLAGALRARRLVRRRPPVDAVLLDRDGTLIEDVPYNGDPRLVSAMPGARQALDRLRRAGIRLGVVSNQSGIARGLLRPAEVEAVNARVEELLGPIGPWFICPHGPAEGCGCRKPAPGLVIRAAAELGVPAERIAVIGDIGSDVEAARAAGARAVLVPTAATLQGEVEAAPEVAASLSEAVDMLLGAAR